MEVRGSKAIDQVDIFPTGQSREATDAPVRLGPKSHVRAVNVLMKRRLGVVTGLVKLGDLLGVVPPLTHPHQTQHHVGPTAELAYQPIAAYLSVGVRRCVPVSLAHSLKH
jgi:hypothetical protein